MSAAITASTITASTSVKPRICFRHVSIPIGRLADLSAMNNQLLSFPSMSFNAPKGLNPSGDSLWRSVVDPSEYPLSVKS